MTVPALMIVYLLLSEIISSEGLEVLSRVPSSPPEGLPSLQGRSTVRARLSALVYPGTSSCLPHWGRTVFPDGAFLLDSFFPSKL